MSKISNVITMLQLLNNGKKYSIKELSELIEVSKRMIRHYKEELELAGIYIDSIRGPYGGYVLNQRIRIPERKFNQKDTLSSLTKYQGSEKKLDLEGDNLSIYNIMTRAIKEKKKVKILYYSYNKGDNERIIYPAELFLYKDGWFVAAYCEIKNDMRHFEFRRIKKYELLNDKF